MAEKDLNDVYNNLHPHSHQTLKQLKQRAHAHLFFMLVVESIASDKDKLISTLQGSNLLKMERNVDFFTVESCSSAKNIYKQLLVNNTSPNVILVNKTITGGSGFELIEHINGLHKEEKPFIVMVDDNLTEDDMVNAILLGVEGFICKPYSEKALYRYVDKYFSSKLDGDQS
jgi:DNA-binding NarL/FixJ family response regulator